MLCLPGLSATAQRRPKGKSSRHKTVRSELGTASFYADKFQGRLTSSGIRYDKNKMTCAHNSLPMGTWLKVTNLLNHRSVNVKVIDRLHHNNTRLVDLSRIAATKLGIIGRGVARVKVEVLRKKPRS